METCDVSLHLIMCSIKKKTEENYRKIEISKTPCIHIFPKGRWNKKYLFYLRKTNNKPINQKKVKEKKKKFAEILLRRENSFHIYLPICFFFFNELLLYVMYYYR